MSKKKASRGRVMAVKVPQWKVEHDDILKTEMERSARVAHEIWRTHQRLDVLAEQIASLKEDLRGARCDIMIGAGQLALCRIVPLTPKKGAKK